MASTRIRKLNSTLSFVLLFAFPSMISADSKEQDKSECVIVLHGLARTANAMKKLATALETDYRVVNDTYPSRKHTIEHLADLALEPALEQCADAAKIHLVTHSLGGILARQYLHNNTIENLGNVVMLGPPNQGSEIVDYFLASPVLALMFNIANGPAGEQLGTQETGTPKALGPVDFSLGVIAGNKSLDPILSNFLPSQGDGKVTVASSKVDGMVDHLTLPVDHTFMMRNDTVINQVKYFLANARFDHAAE